MDILYLDFSKTFDIVPYEILIDNLLKYRLDMQTVRWIKNLLNEQAEMMAVSGASLAGV